MFPARPGQAGILWFRLCSYRGALLSITYEVGLCSCGGGVCACMCFQLADLRLPSRKEEIFFSLKSVPLSHTK